MINAHTNTRRLYMRCVHGCTRTHKVHVRKPYMHTRKRVNYVYIYCVQLHVWSWIPLAEEASGLVILLTA